MGWGALGRAGHSDMGREAAGFADARWLAEGPAQPTVHTRGVAVEPLAGSLWCAQAPSGYGGGDHDPWRAHAHAAAGGVPARGARQWPALCAHLQLLGVPSQQQQQQQQARHLRVGSGGEGTALGGGGVSLLDLGDCSRAGFCNWGALE